MNHTLHVEKSFAASGMFEDLERVGTMHKKMEETRCEVSLCSTVLYVPQMTSVF